MLLVPVLFRVLGFGFRVDGAGILAEGFAAPS